jgi:ADP-ribose pyrophosphatase YjhB (NUDIX family)
MTGVPQWLNWARRLASLAQNGQHFTESPFDRERYEELREIAAEMLSAGSDAPMEKVLDLLGRGYGYDTPKIDVRGAVFRNDTILLVREAQDGKWAMPGGYVDVGLTPSAAVEKEVREESGLIVRAERLVGWTDRDSRGEIPAYVYHIHKLYFICTEIGGDLRASHETTDVAFHPLDRLPPLSEGRTLPWQIELIAARRQPLAAEPFFD